MIHSKTIYKSDLVYAKKDDVILPLSGETPLDISNSAVIPFDNVALGGDLLALRTKLDPLFLSYQISGRRKNQIARLAQGKTIVHSNPNSLMSLDVFYPEREEQSKISDFLSAISRKINMIESKIEDLKKYKEGLLNRGLSLLLSSDKWAMFSEFFEKLKEKNQKNLGQYTVGKSGLIKLEESNYDLSNHLVFYPSCLLVGIGIEEVALSENDTGCVSPVYSVYRLRGQTYIKYCKYFLKLLLWRKKAFITRKSTRREYEVDNTALEQLKLPIENSSTFVNICEVLGKIDDKLSIDESEEESLVSLKSYLLTNMFI